MSLNGLTNSATTKLPKKLYLSVNEWQPFWKSLKEKIVSFSRNYLLEKKVDTESLSRFWPSSSSAKKDSSKFSSQNPLPKYESETPVPPPPKKKTKARVQPNVVDLTSVVQSESSGSDQESSFDSVQRSPSSNTRRSLASNIQESPVEEPFIAPVRIRPYAKDILSVAEVLRTRRRQLKSTILNTPFPVTEQLEINVKIKRIVEAILFVAKRPMTAKQIQQVFPELEQPELQEIQAAIEAITEDYKFRPIELKQVASGYRFQIKQDLSQWVSRLFEEKPPKYSRALLETLAIIAYRQPVTRADIEDIRGVSVSSSIIQTLLEREWVRVVAHKEVPGRPGLYGTTKQFLDYFNITSLNELPALQEIQHLDGSIERTQQPMQVTSEKQETNQRFIEAAGQFAEENKQDAETTA
jgi:segregation and condensation protein B